MMTKKYSFNVNRYTLEKDGQYLAYLNIVDVHKIVDLLNGQDKRIKELEEENKQFKDKLHDIALKLVKINRGVKW